MFAIDRGGIVGADGPTIKVHLTYHFACHPNMVIMTPADEGAKCYTLAINIMQAIRYPEKYWSRSNRNHDCFAYW